MCLHLTTRVLPMRVSSRLVLPHTPAPMSHNVRVRFCNSAMRGAMWPNEVSPRTLAVGGNS